VPLRFAGALRAAVCALNPCALLVSISVSALAAPPAPAALKSEDVVARVEGRPILRRELTYYWMQTDTVTTAALAGAPILDAWRADRGAAPRYSLTQQQIYRALYADPARVAPVLSALITNRLVGIMAKRRGIVVTDAEVKARAHAMFDTFRQQKHISQTDGQIMREFHVPPDIFFEDVRFQEQTERMAGPFVSAELSARNGHAPVPSDWLELRQLYLEVKPGIDYLDSEKRFAEARKTIEGWTQEIRAGKPMEQAAREHNSDSSRDVGGLLGVSLRGAGNVTVEQGIAGLKPGELSAPIRARTGWYVFRIERAGDRIPEADRKAAWQALIQSRRQAFLSDLLGHARITSTIPLSPHG
jgi:hypothetical protein